MKKNLNNLFYILILVLVALTTFCIPTLRANASDIFQDDFSGPLLWTKIIGPSPGGPQPTGSVSIENSELSITADYWWYAVLAVRQFSSISGDFEASVRCTIMSDSGDAAGADLMLGYGDMRIDGTPNRVCRINWDGYYKQWIFCVSGVQVYIIPASQIPGSQPQGRWTELGIKRTDSTYHFFLNGSQVYQFNAPEVVPVDSMAMATGTGIHWQPASHAHYDDAKLVVNLPPDCSKAYADPACLWPPDHKFVDINIKGVTDPDGDPVTITITRITSDEPTATDKGSGGAQHSPDAIILPGKAQVRAERSGDGDGRVYVISFTASDGKGGVSNGSVIVKVPHDQSGKTCPAVDSGQKYDDTKIN